MSSQPTRPHAAAPVIGPDLRAALIAMVRKRVPESEVEDIVQSTLADAIGSPHAPQDSESLRRWIFGVAKNKVVDYHRRAGRESFEIPEHVAGTAAPHIEADLLRWAEKNLPPGEENKTTLDWMLREGEGEKLEWIAENENVPAPRVRQRVSRLRRHLKQHWQKEVALLAALGVLVSILVLMLKRKEPEPIADDKIPRAMEIRKVALEKCAAADWKNCVDKLDEAKQLDPAGDTRPEVRDARDAAGKALIEKQNENLNNNTPPPVPTTTDSTTPPTPSAIPTFSDSSDSDSFGSVKQGPTKTDFVRAKKDEDKGSKRAVTPAPTGSTFPKPTPTPSPAKPQAPSKMKGGTSSLDDSLGSFGSGTPSTPPEPSKEISAKGPDRKEDGAKSAAAPATKSGGGSKKKAAPAAAKPNSATSKVAPMELVKPADKPPQK